MRRPSQEGFILVAMLGALIVLSGLVAAVAYLTRTAVIGAASAREALVTDALLKSGVDLAGYELFSLRRPASVVNGQRIRFNDGVVTLFTASEAGKIDLNTAPPELLAALWSSIGAPGMTPETFAARVVDYRDLDDEPSKNGGAEIPQYVAAGPNRLPANAPFERVDDLQNVLDVTATQARLLAPLVTVHNPSGKIAALEASPAVIRVIPNGSRVLAQLQALKDRANAREGQDQESELERLLGDSANFVTLESEPRAFTVRVEAERNGSRRSADVVLVASRAADALYLVTDRIERPSR